MPGSFHIADLQGVQFSETHILNTQINKYEKNIRIGCPGYDHYHSSALFLFEEKFQLDFHQTHFV